MNEMASCNSVYNSASYSDIIVAAIISIKTGHLRKILLEGEKLVPVCQNVHKKLNNNE